MCDKEKNCLKKSNKKIKYLYYLFIGYPELPNLKPVL